MTTWDKIYKNYQKGGEAWASLSEDIHPLFKEFLDNSSFEVKHALDIGCGDGKYLKLIQAGGFKTDGIDSSETAIKMAKKELGNDSSLVSTDMFEYNIPPNKYDLIFSVAAMHHGSKEQIKNLVRNINKALIENGKVFIVVPDIESIKKWDTFKDQQDLGDGMFAPTKGPEKGLLHSFFSKKEIEKLFSDFKDVEIELDKRGRWVIQATK